MTIEGKDTDVDAEVDAAILRAAAAILRDRSANPDSLWLRVLCRVLTDTADEAEAEAL